MPPKKRAKLTKSLGPSYLPSEVLELDPNGDVEFVLEGDKNDPNPSQHNGEAPEPAKSPEDTAGSKKISYTSVQSKTERTNSFIDDDVRVARASSKHLILASSYFKRMFTGGWSETQKLGEAGHIRIPITDWDREAFAIFLFITHGKTKEIPLALHLNLLYELAKIVDFYECHEHIEFFSNLWLESLLPPYFKSDRPSFFKWVAVSHVFGRVNNLKEAAGILVDEVTEQLEPLHDIPNIIPTQILKRIDQQRERLIAALLSIQDEAIAKLTENQLCTQPMCTSIAIGDHLKLRKRIGITKESQESPFTGLCYSSLQSSIQALQPPQYYMNHHGIMHHCSVYNELKTKVSSIHTITRIELRSEWEDLKGVSKT